MSKPAELAQAILKETEIIESAVEAKDIEIVNTILERRQKLIDDLATYAPFEPSSEIGQIIEKIREKDDFCKVGISQLKAALEQEQYAVKSEKSQITKSKKAYDRYQMNLPGQMSGMSIDKRK
ncbi:hypothetical protein [Fusibacter tunisiensis]|jgi:valyl-tRNA synthetase|uniref:Valyl-tRNA synthetase n=1 Tax=Fusibacter tunisiensis TaxID=1008308 RepID=A0ABS2MPM4_9FIRM|nr:hypothetical protein [Fusibacter tunisiensis]MBM7561333.1 valyl-tRNA synthetase [Fusibacter tunisiensis]